MTLLEFPEEPPDRWHDAFAMASAAALESKGTTSPNPPVGAVILAADGHVVGVGATQPPGGPHAEVMALRQAGDRARGGTAVVTLEPCNHTGRTGPCALALLNAGIVRLRFAHRDPFPAARGGAETLHNAGVDVAHVRADTPELLPWLIATRQGRPHVTVKCAQTMDGFTAALDGTSQWITSAEARAAVHVDRSRRDAIVVGTGTALADNPSLTARGPGGALLQHQPLRVVIGSRKVKAENLERLGYQQFGSPEEALDALWKQGCRDVLVEGGAGLAGSFFEKDLVDAVQLYLAPILLGGGRSVVDRALTLTLDSAPRYSVEAVRRIGPDVCIEMRAVRIEQLGL